MSYEDCCRLLNWQTLEKRREFLSLVQCYDYKLYVKVAILNCYKYSFFVRIVNAWNNLPKDVVQAGWLTLFRNRLRIYMNID